MVRSKRPFAPLARITFIAVFACLLAPSVSAEGLYVGVTGLASQVADVAHADKRVRLGDTMLTSPPTPATLSGAGIDEQTFDAGDTGAGILIGWQASPWLGVEATWTRLGAFESDEDALAGNSGPTELRVDEYALAARFRHRLTERLHATARVGVSHASFDVSGTASLSILEFSGSSGFPSTYEVSAPYEAPQDTTGYQIGFGLDYALTPTTSIEGAWTRHDVRVVRVDSFGVTLRQRFGADAGGRLPGARGIPDTSAGVGGSGFYLIAEALHSSTDGGIGLVPGPPEPVASQPSFAPAPNLGSVPPNPSFPGGVASVPIFAFVLPLRRTLDDEDQGAGLTVGYEVLPWLAFEFGWRRLGNFRDALNSVSSFSVGVEEYAATARVRWPITERLAAVARIGATRARFDVDGSLEFTTRIATITQPLRSPNDRAGYLIGAGTEWRFTKRFAAEVMYTRHDARVIEIDAVSAGVIFRI